MSDSDATHVFLVNRSYCLQWVLHFDEVLEHFGRMVLINANNNSSWNNEKMQEKKCRESGRGERSESAYSAKACFP